MEPTGAGNKKDAIKTLARWFRHPRLARKG